MSFFPPLNLSSDLEQGIRDCGLSSPSEIQKQTLPAILKGQNVIVQGRPGTGKTAAFGIGLLQRLQLSIRSVPQALVLVPTHELAVQVADTLSQLGKALAVRCRVTIGGMPVKEDARAIRDGVDVIVGTPGRVLHLLTMSEMHIQRSLSILVLDEVDLLMAKDFKNTTTRIGEELPSKMQVLLFSTTMSEKTLKAAKQLVQNHSDSPTLIVKLQKKEMMRDEVAQYFICTGEKKTKAAALCGLFPKFTERKTLIFCNFRKNAEQIARELKKKGFAVPVLHSEMAETRRQKIVSAFRKSPKGCLITTDLLAWGFDLSDVSLVVNCNTPSEDEYLHRIYRCSRFGSKGVAISLFKKKELRFVGRLQRQFECKLQETTNALTNIF